MTEFLPMNRKEMEDRRWDRPDFVYVCGDAYVDHPSFGAAARAIHSPMTVKRSVRRRCGSNSFFISGFFNRFIRISFRKV